MKDKLDKYFKQKLGIPQPPPKDAWEYLQNHLPKKEEKRRIIPFWARLSGIAAVLLLMVGFGYWLGTQNLNPATQPELVIDQQDNSNNSDNTHSQQNYNSGNEQNYDSVAPEHLSGKIYVTQKANASKTLPAGNTENKVYPYSNHSKFTNYNHELNSNFNSAYSEEMSSDIVFEKTTAIFPSWNNLDLNPILPGIMPTLGDAHLDNEPDKELTLALNEKPNKEKETKKKKYIDFDRFHISGFASPLAFNTFVGSSMLADEMSEYKTENNITLAYGIKAAYSLNPRFRVRTGVSVIGFEQITNDVPLAVEVVGSEDFAFLDRVNNIQYTGNVMIDNNSFASSLIEAEMSGKLGTGDVQQQASYIEIPLEAELSLFQTNSIGISATGGGSTWLLSKNKIYVHTDDYTQELGKANNLNKLSFSANAGLKFDLNLTDNVKLNVEPNFRYLINPVNNIEKYNPYTVGVNAGVSISLK